MKDLINFNADIFPDRDKIEESIKYRFIENPFSKDLDGELLLYRNENGIEGQLLLMASEFKLNNKTWPAYWGVDYFVKSEFRSTFAGLSLAKKAKEFQYHFGVGFTETSSKIFKLLKEKNAGFLSLYFRPNILNSINYKLSRQKYQIFNCADFPNEIELSGRKFKRIWNSDEIISKSGYWNQEIIEFIRNGKFINWRFFHYSDKYAVYKLFSNDETDSDLPVYFVARPVMWKRMNCLLIVDFRFDLNKTELLDLILSAVTKLSKKIKLSATITGSSLPECHKTLVKKFFFRYGKKREILTNFNNDNQRFNTKNNEIFVTLADSDSEFYFGNNKW